MNSGFPSITLTIVINSQAELDAIKKMVLMDVTIPKIVSHHWYSDANKPEVGANIREFLVKIKDSLKDF